MKFPTILGLIVIILVISLGVGGLIINQQFLRQNRDLLNPEDIRVANITDSQATVTWVTKESSIGQVLYGESNLSQTASDERGGEKFYTHFVTIKDLKENTTYSFKVKNDDTIFPDSSPLEFKTSSQKSTNEPSLLNSKQPISAAVLASSETPATDALVFLQIKGAAPLVSYTTDNGVFVLPLKELRKDDLQSFYNLTTPQPGELIILTRDKKSTVKLTVPVPAPTLPSLLLGQNLDLTEILVSPSPQQPKLNFENNSPEFINKYDLNNDQRVNSLDLATVLDNLDKRSFDQKIDLNSDGKIDQQDVDIIKNSIN